MATVVQSIECLTVTIADGVLTGTADLGKSQAIANCFLRTSWLSRASSSEFGRSQITAALVPDDGDPDRVLVTRADSVGELTAIVYVIEFKPANIGVWRDSATMADDEDEITVTIPNVGAIAKAWPHITSVCVTNSPSIAMISVEVTGLTELTLRRQRDGSVAEIEIAVAYCLADEWTVHPILAELNGEVSVTDTIPAVVRANTFLDATIDTSEGSNVAKFTGATLALPSTTEATAARLTSNTESMVVRGHAIEAASITVQRYSKTLVGVGTGTTTPLDATVSLDRGVPSFAINGPCARSNHSGAPASYVCGTVELTNDNTLAYTFRGHGDVDPEMEVELTHWGVEDAPVAADDSVCTALLGAVI